MQIDRLVGILSILLQQDKVTAPFLAERFEVSRRTINRDIEVLCKAGIPLVTSQGKKGGISIMEGYRMDKTLLTSADMRAILAGLRSLDSVSGTYRYQQLMDKISGNQTSILSSDNHILINLSSWHKKSLTPKIEAIQKAIEGREKIRFTYFSPSGETKREIEPYYLIFQWSSWYVWGYCSERQDYRMFKLNRLTELKNTGTIYENREASVPNFEILMNEPAVFEIQALFDPVMKWRLIEAYGKDSFEVNSDGMLLFTYSFADEENLFEWLLSFGNKVELVGPERLREKFKKLLNKICEIYF